ncbi:hypothetical protein IQ265_12770 [Nodosilinea sp. LEGE 06152]|uniref:hypothetical protein n=1 Tax=Nodosilinea sp. LEGE 06152 TaxID=2777966 RepID=UPI0018808F7E|nr:hypothetical protein [Nodosilinea sp. LEGE 06152]MBE9157692.1 hypothetical protein [Nodosilinea sp. LEGE 06152]
MTRYWEYDQWGHLTGVVLELPPEVPPPSNATAEEPPQTGKSNFVPVWGGEGWDAEVLELARMAREDDQWPGVTWAP